MLIVTKGNDIPIFDYYVLVTFSDLEERKQTKKLSIKMNTGARVNIKQKPYGATLT